MADYPAGYRAVGRREVVCSGGCIELELFTQYRRLLFGIAYRMLGSVQDAEDMVQETYVRWMLARDTPVESPRAFLCTIVTRLCLDHLRSARVRREQYIGPWLPEPLVTLPGDGLSERIEQSESITLGFLLLLERLSPMERAVFVLREVFRYEYDEVAAMVDRSPANCRQILRRARQKLGGSSPPVVTELSRAEAITASFLQGCLTGDLQQLMTLLAPNVTALSDGGGRVTAARNPIVGSDAVARFALGLARSAADTSAVRFVQVNGSPGFAMEAEGRLLAIVALEIQADRIAGIYTVLNPEKLTRVVMPGA